MASSTLLSLSAPTLSPISLGPGRNTLSSKNNYGSSLLNPISFKSQKEVKHSLRRLSVHSSLLHSYCLIAETKKAVNIEEWNDLGKKSRLQHLESQAIESLKIAIDAFDNPTFPCALIAGDVVILEILHRINAFNENKVKVVFVDTFHLFPETYEFLKQCEERYNFKAEVFQPLGFSNKEEYVKKHGSDLFLVDIDEYDRICKVEPFGRALKTLNVDVMINGRRRDHGAERAHLELFEGGGMAKNQPLAYWEFEDCFNYLKMHNLPYHPLHDEGYPSIGDYQSTVPVPKEKWFEYGGERSGRFQGLKNKDGSDKTECGIHVGDAREVSEA